jgi:hypothetical protein
MNLNRGKNMDKEEYQEQMKELCRQFDTYEISLAMFHEMAEKLKNKKCRDTGICCCCGNKAVLEPNGLCRPCADECTLKLKDKPLITIGENQELW